MNEMVPFQGGADAVALSSQGGSVAHASLADLPRDIALGADDREIAASFASAMQGAPREFIHKALRWYQQHATKTDTARTTTDAQDKRQAQAALRAEWGNLYVQNLRAVKQIFANLPIGVQQALESAELDDGTLLLNSEVGLRWLFDLARVPLSAGGSVAAEMAEIQSLMGKPGSRYWRGPDAERLQARYRQLLQAQGYR